MREIFASFEKWDKKSGRWCLPSTHLPELGLDKVLKVSYTRDRLGLACPKTNPNFKRALLFESGCGSNALFL